MKKILMDTSVLGVGDGLLEERLLKPAREGTAKIVLLSLTMEEIERLHYKEVSASTLYDVRKILDFFAKDKESKYTEVDILEENTSNGHIDKSLVSYAKNNDCCVITADKGMAIWCRFYKVPFEIWERKHMKTELKYVREFRGGYYIYLREIPLGESAFVIDPSEQIKRDDGYAHIPIDIGDFILTAKLKNDNCYITRYIVEEGRISKVSEKIYSKELDEITQKLYSKWCEHVKKYDD